MTKVYKDLNALSESLKPEIEQYNNRLLEGYKSDLHSQASVLLRDVQNLWSGYMQSYNPVIYNRTYAVSNGFKLSEPRVVYEMGEPKVEIDLILDDGYMWHSSLWNGKDGHAFMLISEGWRWQTPAELTGYRGGDIYRFTHFDGVGIIDSLLSEYNKGNYEFTFYYEGEEYGGRSDRANHSFTR